MTAPDTLTPRERQVIVALAGGKSAPEIAAALRLSPHTVCNQRRSIWPFDRQGNRLASVGTALDLFEDALA